MSADLIARLEAASEGSRELDQAIALAAFPGGTFDPGQFPAYTTSLDAALTLVPEGARVRELGQWWDINKPGGWFCNIMRWEYVGGRAMRLMESCYTFGIPEDDDGRMPLTAPIPSLALCIAALKARMG